MKMDSSLTMAESRILDTIDELEPGDRVAFRLGSRKKRNYNYKVSKVQGTTVYVEGPSKGKWRFETATGSPKLHFVSPTDGVSSYGTLDALKRWKDVA